MTHMLTGYRREVVRKIEQPVIWIFSLKKCACICTTLVLAHLAHSPILPPVSVNGGATLTSANPAWPHRLSWAWSTFTQWHLSQFPIPCSKIERWLCHSQKIFGSLSLASYLNQVNTLLPWVGWKEPCHCLSRSKWGWCGLFPSCWPLSNWACVLADT